MVNKRNAERFRKRLKVFFGKDRCNAMAYTEDISATGIFIRTPNVIAPGQQVLVKVEMADDSAVELEGRVMWAKKVPVSMFHRLNKSGMGVRIERFTSGSEEYLRLTGDLLERRNYSVR